jgi:hydrophobic/amphiphilic exporter-1 (mainly G- bacteria), HAE1 family
MKISLLAVRRPIFTIMVVLIVILLGIISLLRLPIDLMPDISYPTISVSCSYANAGPEEIEELITRPIEQALSAVPGVEEITSTSSEGQSSVRVTFSWGTDLDAASNDIRDRLDRIIRRLPEEVDRPTLRKFDMSSTPVLTCGVSSNLDPVQARQFIDDQVVYRLERVPGVASITVQGGLEREIQVNLDPVKMNSLAIPLDRVISAIREGNVNIPAGTLERGNLDVIIRTPGEYTDLKQLEDTIIDIRQGVPVKLKEIATIEDSWPKVTRTVRINGQSGIMLSVNKQSGKNTVEIARNVLEEITKINQEIPQIKIIPINNTADYIERSINNVGSAAVLGGIFIVIVLLVFLRSMRSTIIIATAMPVSIIATFALLYFNNFTLNIMTLGGLALGIGMLVDNSIVVLENIFRLNESGETIEKASIDGTEEVTAAIISSTLTTVVVFLPLIFMRGMSGIMFKQLSLVVTFALLCSLVVAITIVPMLCAHILHPSAKRTGHITGLGHKLFQLSGYAFTGMENSYKKLLHIALNNRAFVILVVILIMVPCLLLIPNISAELMPTTDEGEVRVEVEMQVGTRLELLDEKMKLVEEIVTNSVPEMQNYVANTGGMGMGGGGSSSNASGSIRASLKPKSQRTRSSQQIANDLRSKLRNIPGVTIRTRAGQGLFVLRMGTSQSNQVQIEIYGHDIETSDSLAQQVKKLVESIEGIADVRISRESGNPEELILIDRQKASDMNLSVSKIANALQTIISGTRAGNFRQSGDEYSIVVKVKNVEKMDISDILDLTLVNTAGKPVVLKNVINVGPRTGPVSIQRKDQQRYITVSADTSEIGMDTALSSIEKLLKTIPLPRDFSISFGGDYQEQQQSYRELALSCVLALILVYMVMACQYESLRDPFVVMFSVPLAAIGVILMLYFTETTFNIQSFIGCIILGGIVVNNAILLVDHTNLLRRRDLMPLRDAIEEAGRRRLRPILMTATTTMCGLIPLAIGHGEGGEAQAPMARVVIGGMLSASFITLIFVPVIYSIFENRGFRVKAEKSSE